MYLNTFTFEKFLDILPIAFEVFFAKFFNDFLHITPIEVSVSQMYGLIESELIDSSTW